jgi:CheY-like chemotaxis protein
MNGYNVLEAGHGGEALRVSEQFAGPLHLLITDVVMPEMSGGELAARLKQLRPDLKVLFLSGYTEDAVVRHGVSEAESAFLQKPFSLPVLAHKVREVLDQEGPKVCGSRSDQGGYDG